MIHQKYKKMLIKHWNNHYWYVMPKLKLIVPFVCLKAMPDIQKKEEKSNLFSKKKRKLFGTYTVEC